VMYRFIDRSVLVYGGDGVVKGWESTLASFDVFDICRTKKVSRLTSTW